MVDTDAFEIAKQGLAKHTKTQKISKVRMDVIASAKVRIEAAIIGAIGLPTSIYSPY